MRDEMRYRWDKYCASMAIHKPIYSPMEAMNLGKKVIEALLKERRELLCKLSERNVTKSEEWYGLEIGDEILLNSQQCLHIHQGVYIRNKRGKTNYELILKEGRVYLKRHK